MEYTDNFDNDSNTDEDNNRQSHSINNSKKSFQTKYKNLSIGLCEILNDLGMITFLPLAIEDAEVTDNLFDSIFKLFYELFIS